VKLTPEIDLTIRRCEYCGRWFGFENPSIWVCGMCAQDRIREHLARIDKLTRSNAALRGALGRKRRRAKR
jgi:hypothetical protein